MPTATPVTEGAAVTTTRLTKRFGHQTVVADLDLLVPTGAVYGFLGPNGSGKTTTIRMLLGLIAPTSGAVGLLGRPTSRIGEALPRVGSLVEGPAFHPYLSGRANLRRLDAADRFADAATAATRIDAALERVGLLPAAGKRFRAYSLGMRQRLAIAAALLRGPELLLLDEPTNGLDPRGIGEVRDLLIALNEHGTTVVLSSHLLTEVEAMCTRVGVMDAGRLVLTDDLETLRTPTGQVLLRSPHPAAVVGLLDGQVLERSGDTVVVREDDPAALNARLVAAGIAVTELTPLRRSLEQVVLAVTGTGSDRVDRRGR